MFFDIEPAEERLFAEPGELTLRIVARRFLELRDEALPIGFRLRGVEELERLAVADRLSGR
jgi:hypothetical protein